jgi:hypothetical protein
MVLRSTFRPIQIIFNRTCSKQLSQLVGLWVGDEEYVRKEDKWYEMGRACVIHTAVGARVTLGEAIVLSVEKRAAVWVDTSTLNLLNH